MPNWFTRRVSERINAPTDEVVQPMKASDLAEAASGSRPI